MDQPIVYDHLCAAYHSNGAMALAMFGADYIREVVKVTNPGLDLSDLGTNQIALLYATVERHPDNPDKLDIRYKVEDIKSLGTPICRINPMQLRDILLTMCRAAQAPTGMRC